MKRSVIAIGLLLLAGSLGCLKPEPVIYRVSLGMSEEKLLEAVGQPLSRTSRGDIQTLEFRTWGSDSHGRPVNPVDWYVQLVNGKVSAYGKRSRQRSTADGPTSSLV